MIQVHEAEPLQSDIVSQLASIKEESWHAYDVADFFPNNIVESPMKWEISTQKLSQELLPKLLPEHLNIHEILEQEPDIYERLCIVHVRNKTVTLWYAENVASFIKGSIVPIRKQLPILRQQSTIHEALLTRRAHILAHQEPCLQIGFCENTHHSSMVANKPFYVWVWRQADSDTPISYQSLALEVASRTQASLMLIDDFANAWSHHGHQLILHNEAEVNYVWLTQGRSQDIALMERNIILAERAKISHADILTATGRQKILAAVQLAGSHSVAEGSAALMGSAQAQIDYEPIQNHEAQEATSHLKARVVAFEQARTKFNGLIFIPKHAGKATATQENKNLLASKKAKIDAAPRLIIEPSDVVCKHGSAASEIDAQQVYYLGTRGFTENEALRHITQSFVVDGASAVASCASLFTACYAHINKTLQNILR